MRIFLSLALAMPLFGATSILRIEPTATQAIIRVSTDQAGNCTYRVADNAGLSPLVHDVDTALFTGASSDARAGSIVSGTQHSFVAGLRTSALALDGVHYSRALQANTQHWAGVTCGSDSEVVATFQTQNPPFGQTVPEAAPFDAASFGNYAWPTIDFTDQTKTYIDPMTGIALKRVTSPGWGSAMDYTDVGFSNYFDLNSAWTSASNILTWPGSGSSQASYSGSASDPIFVAVDLTASGAPFYGGAQPAASGWTPALTVDDIRVKFYGFGNSSPANRNILVCLSLDSGQTCSTSEQVIALPSSIAAQVAIPATTGAGSYPQPMWKSWASAPPFTGRNFGTVITTVTTSGHTITNTGSGSATLFSREWKAGGKVLVNGTETYTIAAVVNSTTITTVELTTTHASGVAFRSMCAGVRIRKQTGVGSIQISVGYDIAISSESSVAVTGVRNMCSPLTVNVTVDANGTAAAARTARICAMPTSSGHVLFAMFSDTGETRFLSNFQAINGFNYQSPDWTAFDGNLPNSTIYTSGNIWDPSSATQFWAFMQFQYGPSAGHSVLVRVNYTGNFSTYKPFAATNGYRTSGAWDDDHLTYNIVGPLPSVSGAIDQQAAAFGLSNFDGAKWSVWTLSGILPGGVAMWQANTTDGSGNNVFEAPLFFAAQSTSTGLLTRMTDQISTYPMRFWGNHSTQILNGGMVMIGNILGNKESDPKYYLSGPFVLTPSDVHAAGGWTGTTALSASYVETCPNTIDPQWQALGATGNNCVQIRTQQPCSGVAGAYEAAHFPCPWDGTKSMVSPLAPGDRFWIGFTAGCSSCSAETMRVVTTPTLVSGTTWQFWALRFSENYGNLGGSYGGTGYTHSNGWAAAMIPPEARTNGTIVMDASGGLHADSNSFSATHAAQGIGTTSGNVTTEMSGADPVTGQALSFQIGIRWNQTLGSQYNGLPNWNLYLNGRFSGQDTGGGAMESYFSQQQTTAPANEQRWFTDFHHMNPNDGIGSENFASVGAITAALVSGQTNTYAITAYQGTANPKLFPAFAYAGYSLLKDISGPGSAISDATPQSFCYAYLAGECVTGSSAGTVFTSIPQTDANSLTSCIAGWYAQRNPCAMVPHNSAAWGMQIDASRPVTDDNYWRKLTQGFSGFGRQYQFGNITPEPDGQWAFMACYWCNGVRNEVLAMKIPPMPNYETVNRADFVRVPIQIGSGGAGTSARVKFGYAENGAPASFYCTSRQEACVTDTALTPFAYVSSDTLTPTSCSTGCTVNIPAISGRVVYFQIEYLSSGSVVGTGPMQVLSIE